MKQIAFGLLSILLAAASIVCSAQPPSGAVSGVRLMSAPVEFLSGNTVLSGTLIRPSTIIAAVVLVHGSGQQQRNIPFAQALARAGIATLTYDKRGVGDSGGVYVGPEVGTNNVDPANLDLLAEDASAAVGELERISSPGTPVGLIGISQAGWIVPLAAARTPDVKFMVLWSGPLVTTLEQLRFQHFTNGTADFWTHHTEAEVRRHIRSDPDRYSLIATDPRESLRKLSIPGLWLYGDRDVYVPVRLSIERLQALIVDGKPFEYRLFQGLGHDLSSDQISVSADWAKKTVASSRK
jgi:pimeloyl-ACP methyl ester carboxylesterase